MRNLTVRKLHEIIGGRLRLAAQSPAAGEDAALGAVVSDSREARPGNVFWALRGKHADGVNFQADAFVRGATGVVAGQYVHPPRGCWSLQVENSLTALEQLAAWCRSQSAARVIAVTGSVGKTTTRHMIHSVLGTRLSGSASPRNFNNHVGLPLAMLAIAPEHEFAVLEVAASAAGQIAQLADLCQPHVGVITRVGDAHLAGFGSMEAVAEAKTELLWALPAHGWAILDGDCHRLRGLSMRSRAKTVWFGRSLENDLVATHVESRQGRLSFCVDGKRFGAPVWGRHYLSSALAAIAVGRIFGLDDSEIARGLCAFEPPPMRCQVKRIGDATVIDDSYNASPVAMKAALELLRDFDAPGRRIVVCGDMRELGEAADDLHRQLGDQVVTLCGADLLLACGDHARAVVAGARAAGMPRECAVAYEQAEDLLARDVAILEPGDVVLVKGSRAMAMERWVDVLRKRHAKRPARHVFEKQL